MAKRLVVACLACALGLAVWGLWSVLVVRVVSEDFPALPDLTAYNPALRQLLRDGDARARSQPGAPEETGHLGMIYHANQLHDQAEGAYRIAARLAEGDYRWVYGQALLREELGRDATARLQETIRLKPDCLPALQKLGDTFFKQGNLEQAVHYYELARASGSPGGFPQATVALARTAARQQNWQRVIDLLDPLTARDYPFLRPARQLLAEAYAALGRQAQAEHERELLARSDLTPPPPLPDLFTDELTALCCSSTRLLKEAALKSRFGAPDEAIRIARRAVEVEPGDADAHHYLARTLLDYRGGDGQAVHEALSELQEGLRLRPDDRIPLWYFGTFFFKQAKADDLVGRLRTILESQANSAEAQYYLGVISYHQRKTQEAVAHYRAATRLNPDYAEPWHKLGLISAELGNSGEAIGYLERAVRLKPTMALARSNLGVALDQKGRTGDAIRQFEAALQAQPNDATTHIYLAIALTKSGRHEAASRHFRDAVRITPDAADAHYGLGCSLANLQDLNGAAEELKEALRLRPDFAEARAQLEKLTARNFTN